MRARDTRRLRALLTAAVGCILCIASAASTAASASPALPAAGGVPADVQAAVDGPAREEVAASLEDAGTGPGLTAECTPDRLGFGLVRPLFAFTEDVAAGSATTRPVEARDRWLAPVLCEDVAIGIVNVSRSFEGEPVKYVEHRWLADLGHELAALPPGDLVVEHRYSGGLFAIDPVDASVHQLHNPVTPIIDGEVQLSVALSAVAVEEARLRARDAAYTGPDDYRALIIVFGAFIVMVLAFVVIVLRGLARASARRREHRRRAPSSSAPSGTPFGR